MTVSLVLNRESLSSTFVKVSVPCVMFIAITCHLINPSTKTHTVIMVNVIYFRQIMLIQPILINLIRV